MRQPRANWSTREVREIAEAGAHLKQLHLQRDDLTSEPVNLRWRERVARVASLTITRFQCLQTFDEGVHWAERPGCSLDPTAARTGPPSCSPCLHRARISVYVTFAR